MRNRRLTKKEMQAIISPRKGLSDSLIIETQTWQDVNGEIYPVLKISKKKQEK